ncbi:hypothetical protein C8F01DRAFT_696605 [Mycena amicta]|nr:hypothetical protein C8F01DRAFT_696605 [Mycena amicta]
MSLSPDFASQLHFPAFSGLPSEYYNLAEQVDHRTGQPRVHWCLLADITTNLEWPVRPMYRVTDRAGEEYLVAFHLDDRSVFPAILEKCVVGHTMCIMYAIQHHFFDGQVGVRVEEERSVKVIPCSLLKLFEIRNKIVDNTGKCNLCAKSATLKCVKCKMYYCSKECQVRDWNTGHKTECKVGKQIAEWDFDWDDFHGERWFHAWDRT